VAAQVADEAGGEAMTRPFWQIGPNRSAFPDRVKSFPDQRI
jgi:hypothetical protein